MERHVDLHLTTGQIDGSSYIAISSSRLPKVSCCRYGPSDKYVNRMIRRRKYSKVPIDSFVESEWTKWFAKQRRPVSDYSIMEYKFHFDRKLPYWAASFSVRGITDTQVLYSRYKTDMLLADGSWSSEKWFIERELLIPEKAHKRKVIVERVFSMTGKTSEVTLIRLDETGGMLTVHREINEGHGKWKRETREVLNDDIVNKRWPFFRNLPNLWEKYF